MLESILNSIKERRKKKWEERSKKILAEIEKWEQSPEHIAYEKRLVLEKRCGAFLNKLDYFEGSLEEYENMNGKQYKIIDLDNKGQKTTVYESWPRFMGGAVYDKHGNVLEKRLEDKMYELIDRLIEEKCVGMIRFQRHKNVYFAVLSTPEVVYITGYPVKEK